jgi:glucan phosphoethanolaminetransferase (alkaline phosphatase superfamily)
MGVAVLFVAIAYHAARRFGRTGILGAWIASSALLALGLVTRVQARQAALGFSPNQNRDTWTIGAFTLLSLVAFGAAALAAWRHHRRADKLTRRALVSGVAAFFGGCLAFFVVLLFTDVFRFIRQ